MADITTEMSAIRNAIKAGVNRRKNQKKLSLLEEYGPKCFYCGSRYAPSDLQIDHVLGRKVRSWGAPWNLRLACAKCNSSKGESSLEDWQYRIEKRMQAAKNELDYCRNVFISIDELLDTGDYLAE